MARHPWRWSLLYGTWMLVVLIGMELLGDGTGSLVTILIFVLVVLAGGYLAATSTRNAVERWNRANRPE